MSIRGWNPPDCPHLDVIDARIEEAEEEDQVGEYLEGVDELVDGAGRVGEPPEDHLHAERLVLVVLLNKGRRNGTLDTAEPLLVVARRPTARRTVLVPRPAIAERRIDEVGHPVVVQLRRGAHIQVAGAQFGRKAEGEVEPEGQFCGVGQEATVKDGARQGQSMRGYSRAARHQVRIQHAGIVERDDLGDLHAPQGLRHDLVEQCVLGRIGDGPIKVSFSGRKTLGY